MSAARKLKRKQKSKREALTRYAKKLLKNGLTREQVEQELSKRMNASK